MEIETSISSCFYVYVCVSGACLVFGWFEGLLDWVTETHGVAATVCCLIPTPSRSSVCVYLVLKHHRQSLSISTIFTAKCTFFFSAPVVLYMFAYYNAWTKKTRVKWGTMEAWGTSVWIWMARAKCSAEWMERKWVSRIHLLQAICVTDVSTDHLYCSDFLLRLSVSAAWRGSCSAFMSYISK